MVTSREIFRRLYDAYGPQGWWPGASAVEVCVGAVLTQNTAWTNVERALDNLRSAGLLHDCPALAATPVPTLERLVRPAGFYRRKSATLVALCGMLEERFGGRPERLRRLGIEEARGLLLRVRGIGPETADSILLYAAGFPVFVADAYALRVALRHGLLTAPGGYHRVQAVFAEGLDGSAKVRNEYHALLVRVGKEHCRRTDPRCEGCPLEPLLEG